MTPAAAELRDLVRGARLVLWDFDGPVCRLFAGHRAERVAAELVQWLETRGLRGLLTETERHRLDPQVVLRAVDRRHPGGDLVAGLEERLTEEELRAVPSAMPTAYADPLIRVWTAMGARMAVTTDNSPRAVRAYLETRGLTGCFAPHLYGRTHVLRHLKPDPHCLHRALTATGVAPGAALALGGSPADFAAARDAGVPFVGHGRGEPEARALREAGAEHVVRSLESLLVALRPTRAK